MLREKEEMVEGTRQESQRSRRPGVESCDVRSDGERQTDLNTSLSTFTFCDLSWASKPVFLIFKAEKSKYLPERWV